MLSQKFAILDTKFVNIREASFACCKRKTKITEFRDVVSRIRDSGYKIRDVLRSGHYGGGSDVIARYDGYIAQQLHQKKRWRRSII